MSSYLKNVAGGFFGNEYLRDYAHASKTFRANNQQNAPKFKFLFHVYFNINLTTAFSDRMENFGLLVKTVKLPSFNIETHTFNQYNRKRIVQTKIKYDPINVTFHDDNQNLLNTMWYNYYTYYYSDGLHPSVVFSGNRGANPSGSNNLANYNDRNIYKEYNSSTEKWDWGFIGDTSVSSSASAVREPFFKDITIFGFNQHNFIAYTLINPIITAFNHDTYSYSETSGVMENSMTLQYETVVYNQGAIDGNQPDNIVTGFASSANYDRRVSPIAVPGTNSNVLGSSGLVNGEGGFVQPLSERNMNQASKDASVAYNASKNIGLITEATGIQQNVQSALQSTVNSTRQKLFDIPVYGQTPSITSGAGVPIANSQPIDIASVPNIGVQVTSAA